MSAARRALAALALLLPVAGPAAASITGVCPDGSIYIVSRPENIPCADSKQVAPHEVPPLKPEYLPRPYAWQVFQSQNDPNNPYNLVDAARDVRAAGQAEAEAAEAGASAATASATPPAPPLPPVAAAPPSVGPLTLSREELRDLALIVDLSQQRAPAGFDVGDEGSAPALRVRLAHSQAFEERLRAHAASLGRQIDGDVVLFTAIASAPGAFHPNFTFAQAGTAFHPTPDDPRELALLAGAPGPLAADEGVLGYVVLPAGLDLAEPLDVYWNDRRVATTLRPPAP